LLGGVGARTGNGAPTAKTGLLLRLELADQLGSVLGLLALL
jgi:hypothetical protein